MLEANSLYVSIKSVEILRGINIRVGEGEMVGLVGRNGAGKTTAMRALMGILPLRQGSVVFQGRDINSFSSDKRAALGIGYMPEGRRLVPQLTVEENVLLPVWAMKHLYAAVRLKIHAGPARASAQRRSAKARGACACDRRRHAIVVVG